MHAARVQRPTQQGLQQRAAACLVDGLLGSGVGVHGPVRKKRLCQVAVAVTKSGSGG